MILTELLNVENILNLDYRVLGCLGLFLTLSLLFIAFSIRRLLHKKLISGSLQGLSGISLLLASLLFLSIAANLYTYERLTYEQDIAEVAFEQRGKQQFQLTLSHANRIDVFLIHGDEWQIDARIIKWHGWANILGLNSQYRLERISGRYFDIDDERHKPRAVYSLQKKDNVDYWKAIKRFREWLPWIDTHFGNATYLPMADKAVYSVTLTQGGLIARAKNKPAKKALMSW